MWERFRSTLTMNLNLKLVSFAFALVLYSLVHGGQDARRSIVVDLEVRLPKDNSDNVLIGSIPRNVRIDLRGSSQTIDSLRASAVSVVIDLSRTQASHVIFEPKMVHFPEGVNVQVEQFDPASLDLRWEPRIDRDVPVQVTVSGTPAEGFVVKGPLLPDPKSVKVRGPQSEVMVLQHVRVDAFDVRTLAEGVYPRALAVERPSPRLNMDPTSVMVTAEIGREVAERIFPKLPVAVVGIVRAKTQPAEVDVRLVCPPDLVRSLRPEQIVPQVNVTSKDPSGNQSIRVEVRMDRCEAFVIPREVVVHWGP
jgi:hypothetical protein